MTLNERAVEGREHMAQPTGLTIAEGVDTAIAELEHDLGQADGAVAQEHIGQHHASMRESHAPLPPPAPTPSQERELPKRVYSVRERASYASRKRTPSETGTTTPRRRKVATPKEQTPMDVMSTRLKRLRQLQTWMKDDPDLFQIVDLSLSSRVSAAQRRQSRLSAIFAVASLVVGWLLSAISPVSALARVIGH